MNITHRLSRLPWSDRGVFPASPADFTRHRATRVEVGDVLSLDGVAHRTRVRCKAGRLWLTQTGKSDDLVLEPGDAYACDTSGRLVITALDRATVILSTPE